MSPQPGSHPFTHHRLARRLRSAWRRLSASTFAPVVALDLGSESSKMVRADLNASPVVMPSKIAWHVESGTIAAIGDAALGMLGRVPSSLRVESPIRSGVIAQPDLAELLIRHLMQASIERRRMGRPHLVVAAPASATSVQLHALVAAAEAAGASRVTLVRESIAAALGAELPALSARATLLVEFGAEKTEVAVLALGGSVVSTIVPVGGRQVSEAIAGHLRQDRQLLIGPASAEAIKLEIGCATLPREARKTHASGRDVRSGLPATVELKTEELVAPIQGVLELLVAAIHGVLEKTPPELSADIVAGGIQLSGGGSLLRGLPAFLEHTLCLPTVVVPAPSTSVVRGCQLCAENPRLLEEVCSAD